MIALVDLRRALLEQHDAAIQARAHRVGQDGQLASEVSQWTSNELDEELLQATVNTRIREAVW